VRDDGKPLQWHRHDPPTDADAPVPLSDPIPLGEIRFHLSPPPDEDEGPPLPLA
jgi:hypothetical protein